MAVWPRSAIWEGPMARLMTPSARLNPSTARPVSCGSLPELYPADYVTRANGVLRLLVTIAILSGVALAGVALDTGKGATIGGVPTGRFVVGMVVIGVALFDEVLHPHVVAGVGVVVAAGLFALWLQRKEMT